MNNLARRQQMQSALRDVQFAVREQPRMEIQTRGGDTQYNLAAIWNSNSIPVVRKAPESPVEFVQDVVERLCYEFGIDVESEQVSYHTDEKGKAYTAVTFTTDCNMFSVVGSQANQHVKQYLTEQLRRRVDIGGERHRIIVWIY